MANFPSKVIAYYTPPKGADGKQASVRKYEMWQIDFEEAKKGPSGPCWSLTEPKAGTAVEDKVPVPVDLTAQSKAAPPPVLERQ